MRNPSRSRLRFLVVFGFIVAGLIAAMHYPYPDRCWQRDLMHVYLETYARVAGSVISLFDASVRVEGLRIHGRFALIIVRSCDAWEAMALLVAAILAFPAAWARRAAGLLGGVGAVFVANVARIFSLYVIGVQRPDLLAATHEGVWPAAIVCIAVLAFLIWARWAQGAYCATDTTPA